MNKTFKTILIIIGILAIGLFGAYKYMISNTKKGSPEATANYENGANIKVKYCQPSKKGREIFGKLVPFGEAWRTGANEATTFETNKPLTIGGTVLPEGIYTIWTIPQKDTWTVIFDRAMYGWGAGMDGKASYKPGNEALKVVVPVENLSTVVEKFNIAFTDSPATAMVFAWDTTKVTVLIMK
jgi:hypothetical protein